MHYPDFLHSGARDWWRRQLAALHDMAPWDGLWIDMNEASNFCTGEVSLRLRLVSASAAEQLIAITWLGISRLCAFGLPSACGRRGRLS